MTLSRMAESNAAAIHKQQHVRMTQPPCSGNEDTYQQAGHACSPHVDATKMLLLEPLTSVFLDFHLE